MRSQMEGRGVDINVTEPAVPQQMVGEGAGQT